MTTPITSLTLDSTSCLPVQPSDVSPELAEVHARLGRDQRRMRDFRDEVAALEAELAVWLLDGSGLNASSLTPLQAALRGQRILYVGGRPSTKPAIQRLVQRCAGEWLPYSGSLDDPQALLDAGLSRAHRVVFPMDCFDGDAMDQLIALCLANSVRSQPLRSASLASFVTAMCAPAARLRLSGSPSHFCLRHG